MTQGIHGKDIMIFTGNANKALAQSIAKKVGVSLGRSNITAFADGEISVSIGETVRGSDVFVIQPTCNPVNNNLMELLLMIDAFQRASASRITAVIPYLGYARQDRKIKARDPISAKLVADIITAAGADRVLTMDLHTQQLQGFFSIPVDNLMASKIFIDYFDKLSVVESKENIVVVSPDLGSVARTRAFAEKLDVPIAIIDKRRPKANVSEVVNIIGDVEGKTAIIIDDIIDTAGTLTNAGKALMEKGGAKKIIAVATHAVLSDPAIERISNSNIEKIIVADTIPLSEKARKCEKIEQLTVAPLFAKAIHNIYNDKAISPLFL